MDKLKTLFKEVISALKTSFLSFIKHDTGTLGAALSYYTVYSIAPIIIIVLSVAGALLGRNAIEGELERQLKDLFGSQSAAFWQDVIQAAYKPGKNLIIAIIAVTILIIGATSVFGQLRTSLNVIWNVRSEAKKPVLKFIVDRLFSFAMIACLIFLLLVSLVVHSGIEAFTHYFNNSVPNISATLLKVFDEIFSLVVTIFLFSLIYRFMSDVKIKWRYVWSGSFFTALLFLAGKYVTGEFLEKSNLNDEYGAAGSVVLVLTWVFYSSQIFFLGAEFTRAIAAERGILLGPKNLLQKGEAV